MEKTDKAKSKSISPIAISTEEYKTGWSKSKANTSSNPTGPDYAMYKCTTHDETLTLFETLLLNIPYQTGYSPSR